MTGLGTRQGDALLTAIRRATLPMKSATPERVFEMAMARLGRLLHARRLEQRYNPNWPSQPRVPRGNPDGGRWTDGGASRGEDLEPSAFEESVSGEPTRRARPLRSAPRIPRLRPDNSRYRNDIIKDVARWARILWRTGGPLGAFLGYVDETWIRNDLNEIEAYLQGPKTLEELHADVSNPQKGFHIHHVVEQGPARKDKIAEWRMQSRENKVRIPALIHRELTAWYNTKNDAYGGLTPRKYLRDKSWDERYQHGLRKLRDFGVLK